MNFYTYEISGRGLYARLADAVASILSAAIRLQPGLRLQHIQQRAKEPASLRKKLARANALDSEDIGAVAKDLAGCRLVFLHQFGRGAISGIWNNHRKLCRRLGSDKDSSPAPAGE
jgi:ppGpp synthetase/RelA/SpoT-type nucleotidyltranferase